MRILGATGLEPAASVVEAARRATALLDRWDDRAFDALSADDPEAWGIDAFAAALGAAAGPGRRRLDPLGDGAVGVLLGEWTTDALGGG